MVKIRKAVARDRSSIYEMLQQCDFLTPIEIEQELSRIDQMLFDRRQDLFHIIIAEDEHNIVGYACYGPESLLKRSYIIYNIISSPLIREHLVEEILISHIEDDILKSGGNRVFIELPRDENFNASRAVYLKHEYRESRQVLQEKGAEFNRSLYAKNMFY